ncbi:CDP-alcohol phosphatidyltransferase [Citrobacter koseri]|uniref:CDP-alcohol phosphatidyltransferase n=1 Tax=Citrobacter koseri TaxID=545 RepID=A0A2X2WQ97_CITKO|nr:CDP-alcohol phosphatidyltransferase [Citrobacter koseri]
MFDRHLHPRVKPLLHRCAAYLDKPAITPDGLTLFGFAIGVLALPFLALGWYLAALAAIVLNRLFDGLDGALARRRGLTDAGGFLDITLDFLFYALVPFGFILAAPEQNALAGAGCCLRLSVRAVVFWRLRRWRRSIRLIIRAMRTNRFTIWAG